MNSNIKTFERIVRYFLGVFLLTWAIAGGPGWTFIGLFFLFTGSFGVCPLYAIIGSTFS